MSGETKLFAGILLGSLILVLGAAVWLSQPAKPVERAELLAEETVTAGNREAKVYLVEWSDFQCPACLAVKPYVDEVIEKYGDRIVFGYRHFPLPQHPWAKLAAQAAVAAQQQDKFWEMYDYLFTSQAKLNGEFIRGAGKAVGLDEDMYLQALESDKVKAQVEADIAAGQRLGLTGTPAFFLNGVKLELSSFSGLETEVAKALE